MHKTMRKIWVRLTADRRQFGLLCGLLFVGLLLWARIIVIARPARTAIAEPVLETKMAAIVSAGSVVYPVTLDAEQLKNPFSVSASSFPIHFETADNNVGVNQNTTITAESGLIATLQLEAVMGEMAMINGRVVQIGDEVGLHNSKNPLRLVEIQGRKVIISAGEHRYELSIAPPR
jgi:hypothetical protein